MSFSGRTDFDASADLHRVPNFLAVLQLARPFTVHITIYIPSLQSNNLAITLTTTYC